jgi:hypothetical protein
MKVGMVRYLHPVSTVLILPLGVKFCLGKERTYGSRRHLKAGLPDGGYLVIIFLGNISGLQDVPNTPRMRDVDHNILITQYLNHPATEVA